MAEPSRIIAARYELLSELGEGTFAYVYRAKDLHTGEEIAIKRLKQDFFDVKEVIERFRREIFAVASLSSPHLVGLRDFGISKDDAFIVMDLVNGGSLRSLIKESWSPRAIVDLVGQMGHALAAAHAHGVVHRDLKPENILLEVLPKVGFRVRVVDFGFVQNRDLEHALDLTPLTRAGFVFGTPHYMAPEQVRGKEVDARADLFALGIIAYELLAGARPFGGADPRAVMFSVAGDEPPPIEQLPGKLERTAEVNAFFARALAKDPAARPQDAETLVWELERALFGEAAPDALGRASRAAIVLDVAPVEPEDQTIQLDDVTVVDEQEDVTGLIARPKDKG